MAGRKTNRLTTRTVGALKEPGRHADGDGLYLVVETSAAKRWVYLFRWKRRGQAGAGRLREMGLGSAKDVSLAEARELVAAARKLVKAGVDPIAARKVQTTIPTFGELADDVVAALKPGWRNPKHAAQWEMTLEVYAEPLRAQPVDEITADDVLAVLKPLWNTKPETAARTRGRIERVMDAAKAKGYRTGENPAALKGNLDHWLPKRQKLTRGHHAALPPAAIPAFLIELRKRPAIAALALELTILAATRTSETLGAKWPEIDLAGKVWTIPAERTKLAREHRVPLSDRAVEILESALAVKRDDYIFPGSRAGRPLSGMAMEMLLRRMQGDQAPRWVDEKGQPITVHGFRSTFRDWCGDFTSYGRELAEQALAHAAGDATELAYRRGDALERRRDMMQAWANYCGGKSSVIEMARTA